MKAILNFSLFAAICLTTTQVHAQMDDPDPNDNGGNGGSTMECPDHLLFSQGRHYYYQKKNCGTSQMGNGIAKFESQVTTGCLNGTSCNCAPETTTQAEYTDAKARLFVPFGSGVTTHQSSEATELVKAGGKVFRTISIRIKGKKTTGADNEIECTALFGSEVAPATATTKMGTLAGNKLTYDGREFTVTTKAPPSTDPPS